MAPALHEHYDLDERRMVAASANELWTDHLIDLLVDVASPILEAASWHGVPENAPSRWSERSTATLSLAAMAIRSVRAIALTVRAGYAAEAQPHLRRLHEIAGHARQVALDPSGQYAENWLHGRGKAGKPRVAFDSAMSEDSLWNLMSGQAHADFNAYANLSATVDEDRRIIHGIGPCRQPPWDNVWLWLTARQLTTVLACVLKVCPHIDQTDFLAVAEQVVTAEERLGDELGEAHSGERGARQVGED